jgi:hypothetical protein
MALGPIIVVLGYKLGRFFSIRKIPRKGIEFPHLRTRDLTGRKTRDNPHF